MYRDTNAIYRRVSKDKVANNCHGLAKLKHNYKHAFFHYREKCREHQIPLQAYHTYKKVWYMIVKEVTDMLLYKGLHWLMPMDLGRLGVVKANNSGRLIDWDETINTGKIVHCPIDKKPYTYMLDWWGASDRIKYLDYYKMYTSRPFRLKLREAYKAGYDYPLFNKKYTIRFLN
jgi:hypothetical protein